MTTRVKICGLNSPEAVEAAVAAGADWLGFIVFEKSPRAVTPEIAGRMAALKGRAESVAVMVDPDDDLLVRVRDEMAPDIIQLHGKESPGRCDQVRAYAQEGVWKAFGISAAADLDAARAYEPYADGFVFDAKPPRGADRPGGWGAAYDWSILEGFESPLPWLLSGGLTPGNVADAIAASGARAVDVASGVETSPGVKDLAAITAFVEAAKSVSRGRSKT